MQIFEPGQTKMTFLELVVFHVWLFRVSRVSPGNCFGIYMFAAWCGKMERQRLMYTHLAYTWYVEYLVMYIEIETRSTHCLIMFTMFTCSRCACNSLVDIRKMVGSWQWFCLEGHQLWLDESTALKERYSQKGINSIHGAYFLGDLHLPQGSITNHMAYGLARKRDQKWHNICTLVFK